MSNNQKIIIKADKLKVGYRDLVVFENASFEVGQGEYVGILGPNGAGKTTLIKLLLGLINPDSGKLQIFGQNPTKGNSRIGYVPQRRPINEDMNLAAIEFVKLGLNGLRWGWQSFYKNKIDEKVALDELDRVNALDLAYRPLGVLSGGELQRIFLAQALIGKPDLLLLDEPLANLDIRHEVNLIQLIHSIVKTTNVSVLLIAHDLNPLLPALDKVIYVANGQISSGLPSQIISSKSLSNLYGSPIEVLRDSRGRVAVLGVEESAHPHV